MVRVYTVALWLGLASSAAALPPVAVIEAADSEVSVGTETRFSAGASFDPDDDELTFTWDFDDGSAPATGADVTHVFVVAGAYRVRVVVSDGTSNIEAGVTTYVLNPVATPSARSNVVCELEGAVFTVAAPLGSLVEPAGSRSFAGGVEACATDATEIWVATTTGVTRLDRDLNTLQTWPLPGARFIVTDGRWVVAYAPASGTLWIKDGELDPTMTQVSIDGGALALRDDVAWIPTFRSPSPALSGRVERVRLIDRDVSVTTLVYDPSVDTASSGGGVPNLLGAIAISPDAQTLWIGGTKSNTERGVTRDGRMLTPENRVRALLTPVDLPSESETLALRLDANDAGMVSAIEFSPNGRFAYLAHPGIGAVSVYDLAQLRFFEGRDPGATVPFTARIAVGVSVDALLRVGTELHARVRETMEHVVFDIADPTNPVETSRVVVAVDPRATEVAWGAVLFNSSVEPIHSRGGYVSCASCHPGGSHDGRTWDFTQVGEGLRNTIDLRGRAGVGHGAIHWSGNFDEVQDFENDIVFAFGGTGLAMDGLGPHPPLGEPNAARSPGLDALAAYVTSLDRVPDSPHELDDSALRGRALFFSEETGCRDCHRGESFTDSSIPPVLHDVGTLLPTSGDRLGAALVGIDTPTLLGVWATAPYLHDGRADTLRAVLTTHNVDDRHGRTSHLTATEIDDLVAYLRSLDIRPERATAPSSGGCSASSSSPWSSSFLVLALAVFSPMRRY